MIKNYLYNRSETCLRGWVLTCVSDFLINSFYSYIEYKWHICSSLINTDLDLNSPSELTQIHPHNISYCQVTNTSPFFHSHPFYFLIICVNTRSYQLAPAPLLSFSRLNPAGSELNTVGLRHSLTLKHWDLGLKAFLKLPPHTLTINPFCTRPGWRAVWLCCQ